ncbi:MAG: hypothetical protein Q8Q10_00275 [bacterium]|nr:hypothetical protein [bacterium]
MNTQELIQSKYFKIIAASVGVLVVALVSFASGVAVGFHKAKFSYAWGENYERNFVGGARGMTANGRGMTGRFGLDERDFRNAHGVAGSILSLSDGSLVIKDKDNKENSVAITEKTLIKSGRATVTLGDLKVEDKIVVIGRPGENGVVNADLIRVFEKR